MFNFELERQKSFARIAEENLARVDTETGMIPGPKKIHHTYGAHSLASGWDIRSTAETATALAMTGHTELAWKGLTGVLDHQDTDPQSFTYGNFFWYGDWKVAFDPNATSFVTPCLCYVLRHKRDEMPVALRQRLESSLLLAIEGIDAHRATWMYTNIALLNMASKFLIGDVLDNARARNIAYWDWEEWRNHTTRMGMINEYNSVCYTWVQVHSFAMMLTCKADESFLRQVRQAMRHLITSTVIDYHPNIGRITGPQSRAYEGDRRLLGQSAMDSIMHYLLQTQDSPSWGLLWLGVPIGPEDILPMGQNLSLPRTTKGTTMGFTRTNHLATDFALGSISGQWPWEGSETPFFLAYRSTKKRGTVAFLTPRPPEGHFSCQREGSLLVGCTWLLNPESDHDRQVPQWWRGQLTGLNTGRPYNLIQDKSFTPSFVVELGHRDLIRLYDENGNEIDKSEIRNPKSEMLSLVVETESICVGLRFMTSNGSLATLTFAEEEQGEIILTAQGNRDGLRINDVEAATLLGFLLHVVPKSEGCDPAAVTRLMTDANLKIIEQQTGWQLSASLKDNLEVDVPAQPGCFYSVDDQRISPNQWAKSLDEASE